MKRATISLLLTFAFLLAGCASAAVTPTAAAPTEVQATQTSSPEPSTTPGLVVIYDFLKQACEAAWSNNGQSLNCPSQDYVSIGAGFVGVLENPNVEGLGQTGESALLTHPSKNGSFQGIFGRFPAMAIRAGDEFRARLACLEEVEAAYCNVEFSLEYYDANGKYHGSEETGWMWQQTNDSTTADIFVDLSQLAGQTVQLVLVVRDNGDSERDYALWLHPQLWRKEQ